MTTGFALASDHILIDSSDPAVPVVSLNRPQRRNAMTLAMWRELGRVFQSLGRDADARAIILTGAGGAFSAGADISEFPRVRATPEDARAYEAAGDACLLAIRGCPKPTIAAVSGACFGGGVGLALTCDFRLADATAYFAIPAARLSNVYGLVETRSLLEAVGLEGAKEVLFTGRRYQADAALKRGLVSQLIAGDALAGARVFAESMRHSAPLTIKGAKIVLDALLRSTEGASSPAVAAVMDEAIASADYKEGVAAFAEKRDPVFRGI